MRREQILESYRDRKEEIENRLKHFKQIRDASEERVFQELVFVILTSQSSAEKSWEAAEELEKRGLLLEGAPEEIAEVLKEYEIQYEENKASYIVENRKMLSQPTLQNPDKELKLKEKIDPEDIEKTRKWLVENIKGISWKGASHFLRNIGYGDNFAIVSGYILKKLHELGNIESTEPPGSAEEYFKTEKHVQILAKELGIGVQELDLVLWSMETGEVFK